MKYSIEGLEKVEVFKDIIESTSTGAKTSQEILDVLTRAGIDWHVTAEGTLMYRYWQIGAEGFVSPEKAAIIQSTRSTPKGADEMDWLSKNLQRVREQYGGKWIAIYGKEIVATAPNLSDLVNRISELDSPFITYISTDPIIWRFVYGIKNF